MKFIFAPRVLVTSLVVGLMASGSGATLAQSTVPAEPTTSMVRDALSQAAGFGDRSLIASVVENARLTPQRAGAIEATAVELRPDIADQIRRAVSAGRELAAAYPAASLAGVPGLAGAAVAPRADALPYPGGNPAIPRASLPEFQRNYSLDAMGVATALEQGLTGKGVVVGVIDTGIDMRPDGSVHPEFAGRIDPRSTSFLYWLNSDVVCQRRDTSQCPTFTDEQIEAAFQQGPTDTLDQGKHGTHVSGIIGAGQNGFGMQGVAPGAMILAVKAIQQGGNVVDDEGNVLSTQFLERCGPYEECQKIGGDEVEWTKGFAYLAQFRDVRVINGSFGPGPGDEDVSWDLGNAADQDELRREAVAMRGNLDAGQIIVMAAGNSRIDNPVYSENPSGGGLYPFIRPQNQNARNSAGALIYDDHGSGLDLSFVSPEALAAAEQADGIARGRIIVVVALDAYNQLASYSQMCGAAKEWCVSAPGGDKIALDDPSLGKQGDTAIYSTVPTNSYASYSGTSMASPNVAGAIAILIEAYPTFTPAEIVEILFMTAEDLGAPGVDAVYGWGLVRLDRALSVGPVGMTETGTYTVGEGGGDTTWMVDFTSQGALEKTGSGTLAVQNAATFQQASTVDGGTLSVNGSLTTPTLSVAQGGTLSGTGAVVSDVTVAGLLSPGNSPGTLTVTGDVTLTSTATTRIEVDGPGTGNGAGNFDRILVQGTGSVFTAGGTLAPVLRGIAGSATNTFTPTLGQSFVFVQAPSVAGSFAALTQPSAGLPGGTRFDVLYSPTALALAVTPLSYASLGAVGVAQTANERALGAAIDAARPAAGVRPSAASNDLYTILYSADAAGLDAGFSSLAGQVHAEMGTTAVRAVGRFADTLGDRQMGIAMNRLSARGTPFGTGEAWAAGEVAATDVGTSGGLSGYDVRATNGAVGADWRFGFGAAGFALSYEYADVSAGANGSGDVDTYQGGLYGTFDAGPVAFALRGGLSWGDLSTSRLTSLGSYAATASADGSGFGGFAEATAFHAFETPAVTVTPSATLGYRGFRRDAATETGSVFALTVPAETFTETQTTLAVALSHRFALANGVLLEPVASVGWRHDFGGIDRGTDLGLLGAAFSADGAEVGDDAFLGSLGLTAVASDRFALGASYQAEIRDNLTGHTFAAQASIRF
ncbi:subtilase-type serine protease [Amorphus suaedae]